MCFQSPRCPEKLLLSVSESYAVFSNLEERQSSSWIESESPTDNGNLPEEARRAAVHLEENSSPLSLLLREGQWLPPTPGLPSSSQNAATENRYPIRSDKSVLNTSHPFSSWHPVHLALRAIFHRTYKYPSPSSRCNAS